MSKRLLGRVWATTILMLASLAAAPANGPATTAATAPAALGDLVAQAQSAMGDKRYAEAASLYDQALKLDQHNPALWVASGDALYQMSGADPYCVRKAREAWDQALAIKDDDLPALDRVMNFWSEMADVSAISPEVYSELRKAAEKLHAADPRNAAAEIAIPTSIIRPWLAGVETDEAVVVTAMRKCEALMSKYPEHADLPMYVAQAKLRLAQSQRQRGRDDAAARSLAESDAIMAAALERSPTAAMNYSAARVAQTREYSATNDIAARAEWSRRKQAYYAKTLELIKPDDARYVEVMMAAARASAERGAAEKILRELYKQRPDDPRARLALAEEFGRDPARHDEALAILDLPFSSSRLIGPRAFTVRELQIRTLVLATNLRLDQFARAGKDAQPALLEKINPALEEIEQLDGQGARALRLRGKLLRAQGKTIDAIRTLEKARMLADINSAGVFADRLDHWETIRLLARCYVDTHQLGRAKQLLQELVSRFPGDEPSRILLAQVLLKEGSLDEAEEQIKSLLERQANDPDVIKLKLQLDHARLRSAK